MPNHCRCCSGKFLENDVLGDCPGCQECADADEWHRAIMEEACDAGERDEHCECVPVLRKACAEKDAEIATLEAATRKVVEALRIARQYVTPFTYDMEQCDLALADPTLVALGRE